MGTDDKQRQFDEIVAHLTRDYPSLAGRRRWPRRLLVTVSIVAGVLWGLLSVAMVAWGAAGVVLTCAVVTGAGAAVVYTHRDRRAPRWRR
ncbi:hypothetical protein [Actinoplanes sp. TFC3]|uniref:hypothetical protein n=1 Tax=Actinoplanes sp. TFC3 TaxID=1710355 RepID=UPI00082ADC2A|nr:hypothetical protein [Actinoplanes sp. TFC3]